MLSKIINFCKSHKQDLFIILVILLVALISFGLGRLSKIRENKTPITIENATASAIEGLTGTTKPDSSAIPNPTTAGGLVVSKNGTKYHYPWCSGAKRIKESNKIWFATAKDARKAGYAPASNCKGLE